MADVELRQVTKSYDGNATLSVKPLDVLIKDKEFIVIVGPSGCGKSTTLRMIVGLENVTSGALYIEDELVNFVPSKDRDIAMVFQNYALYPHMTIYDNIGFPLKMKQASKQLIKERVHEVAKILQLMPLLKRKPAALSGGQRQRVALGRAMVRQPKAFLLDEPLSNLDAKLRVEMRSQIVKLHRELKTTFIYVTHDQTEAMTMGDRIMVMRDGLLEQMDTPIRLYSYPRTKFVAEFIGSPQMNVFLTQLSVDKGQISLSIAETIVSVGSEINNRFKGNVSSLQNVYAGIRPEHLKLTTVEDPDAVKVTIDTIENLGHDLNIFFQMNHLERMMSACVPASANIQVGDEVYLKADPNRWYLFDGETEEALLADPAID